MLFKYGNMTTTGIEFTHSGVHLKGDWEEVCSFAKGLENAIEKAEASEKTVDRYRNWRPRKDDSQKDLEKKTVEEARLKVSDLEENGIPKKVDEIGDKENSSDLKVATSKIVKELYLGSARCFSKVEEMIYGKMMLIFNPYFFDDAEFSANLIVKDKDRCHLKFNFNNGNMREKVKTIVKG